MNFFYLKSNTCTYVLTKPGSNYLIQCQNIKKITLCFKKLFYSYYIDRY